MDHDTMTILAVDDQHDNLITLKAVLSDALPQATLIMAHSGRVGLDYAEELNPDVILLDIVMPDMDGFEVCQLIKSHPVMKLIPVLFLTALQTNRQIRQKALAAGAEGFLNKPLNEVELVAQILTMAKIKQGNLMRENQNARLKDMVDSQTKILTDEIQQRIKAQEALTANRDLLSYIVENDRSAVAVFDRSLRYIHVSQRYLQDYKIADQDIIGKFHYDVFPDLPDEWHQVHQRCLQGEVVCADEDRFIGADGKQEWLSWQCHPWYERTDSIGGMILYTEFITERKQAETALRESEERYRSIFDQSPLGITLTDSLTGQLYQANQKFMDIVGRQFDPDEDYLDWMMLTHPDDLAEDLEKTNHLLDGRMTSFGMNKRFFRPDGTIIWVHITVTPSNVRKDDHPCHLCMVEDISVRKQREDEILYLNNHDVLTGLYNRSFFDEQVRRLDVERQLPLSIIIGDINGLKMINDAFGHEEGDRFLVETANILRKACRAEDILARVGGDEFSILLPQTDGDAALAVLNRINDICLNYRYQDKRGTSFISISLGYGTKTIGTESMQKIQKMAEDHMYRRKLLEQRSLHNSFLLSIKAAMHEKSHETREHGERLAELSRSIGVVLRLSDAQLQELELLSNLHDIGKIVIDDHILLKPGKLTDEEWSEMKKHPEVGYRIAQASPDIRHIADYILAHHERWDGRGYPRGTAHTDIPLLARILAVVDSFDAMTNDRSYRQAMTIDAALDEIKKNAGTQFDPDIATIFCQLTERRSYYRDARDIHT